MDSIKVMIVDDQPIIREGLKMILSLSSDIEVVRTASNGEDAIKACGEKDIDVILMDIRMPGMDGVKTTEFIKEKFPGIKIIILTTFNDDEFIFDALKNGASSYLLKDVASEEIINSIRVIHMGGSVFHGNIAEKLVDRATGAKSRMKGEKRDGIENLTPREIDISKLVAEGMSNKEISQTLYITEGTVKNHITNILSKLGLSHRTQIALYVVNNKKT